MKENISKISIHHYIIFMSFNQRFMMIMLLFKRVNNYNEYISFGKRMIDKMTIIFEDQFNEFALFFF